MSNEAIEWELIDTNEKQKLSFTRIHIPFLRLYNNAHMLFIQGMGVSQVFLASELRMPGGAIIQGPMIYICGKVSEPWKVPFGIEDLVLAKLIDVPDARTPLEQVTLALFNYEFLRRKK